MQLNETQMRKDFEKWCENGGAATLTHVFSFGRHPNQPRYLEGTTEICWLAWRAALRAQADARPAGHFFKASRVHPWVQVEKECPNAVPLYTHPEASAPGLSEEEIRQAWIDASAHSHDGPDHIQKFARAILTRASAATVAEPSDMCDAYVGAREDAEIWKKRALEAEDLNRKFIASVNGPTHMGEPVIAAQQAEHVGKACGDSPEHVGIQQAEPSGYRCADCKLPLRQGYACGACGSDLAEEIEQAEPVGDERAAFEAVWARIFGQRVQVPGYDMFKRDEAGEYVETTVRDDWRMWQVRAAQSGQRAGVAEIPRYTFNQYAESPLMRDDVEGEWVKLEDVEAMLAAAPTHHTDQS